MATIDYTLTQMEKMLREILQDSFDGDDQIKKELHKELMTTLNDMDFSGRDAIMIIKGMAIVKKYPILLNFIH